MDEAENSEPPIAPKICDPLPSKDATYTCRKAFKDYQDEPPGLQEDLDLSVAQISPRPALTSSTGGAGA